MSTRTLVLAAHVDPQVAAPWFREALSPDVELYAFVEPGLSSAYHAFAARLRDGGRLLPALLAYTGASVRADAHDRIVFLSWSAPYALLEELLVHPEDAAALTGWVALDSGYGDPTPGVIDLARRARAGEALYWAGFTDVPTTGYRSSAAFLAEVQRQAGDPAGLFHVEHWPHDRAGYAASSDKAGFWRKEHVGALHRGPAFLASALEALGSVAPTERRPPAQGRTLRASVLELARAALAAGVHEAPAYSNRGQEIDAYLRGCVRGGQPLGVIGVPWCAAFVAWCLWRAAYGGEAAERARRWSARAYIEAGEGPPVGWRAAVAELVADARGTSTWHDVSEGLSPEPGDLLVMGRVGQDPQHGGLGHVAIVEEAAAGGGLWAIGGNESDAVRRTLRGVGGEADERQPVVGWIEVVR